MILLILVSLQFESVQTYFSKKVATYLSEELDSEITLDRVYFKPFSSLELVNFKLKDHHKKTLLSAEAIEANFILTQFFNNRIFIEGIKLKKAEVNFEIYKDSTNFTKYINYFTSDKKEPSGKKKLTFDLAEIEFENNKFTLINHNFKHHHKGVDFSDLALNNISGIFKNIQLDSILSADISNLTFKEKSGLFLRKLSTKASYGKQSMEFEEMYLATNRSIIQDYIRFDFTQISDFRDFMRRVHITSNVVNSKVDSRDIEFFAPVMKKVVFDTNIKKGKIRGTVANIEARNIQFNTAKQTELMGSLTIKGLPNINKTIFDISLQKLKTSIADIETLVPKFANIKKFILPKELHQLKNIDFIGNYTGLYNDFKVNGHFQTAIGDFSTTTQIDLKKFILYKGNIRSEKINIGQLLSNTNVGNTGIDINFDGQGLNFENLKLTLNGKLKNSQIQHYTYSNIFLKGTIQEKILQAEGEIVDPNLRVSYNTLIDWQNTSPSYLLDADIGHAQLNNLNWLKNDSVTISKAKINTNLIGNTLNNFIGHFDADSVSLETSKGHFEINKINFTADGDQSNRLLYLNSDIADAKMSGNIDLNTISAYFSSLAMRYAPAIGLESKHYNPQNFDMEINVKSFQPIAPLLDPALSLDDGAHLKANFSTDNFTANFVAFSPKVTYKGIKVTNLAINENADEKAFSLDLHADRINFTDSVYINHVKIQNILANDSLNFKIELSENKAKNYLDLKGNIHFAHNAPAYIQLQPSTIIINKEAWELNKTHQMRVSKGKIHIDNLLLTQAEQQIAINGILSNKNDNVKVDFNQFNLTSLNGITNPLGIHLSGLLNGEVQLSSVFKKPFASTNIKTDDILYNDIPVGNLLLKADFDPQSGLANIDLDLADRQKRGVKLYGNYNFFDENKKLDIQGKLIETDLAIFQPFLKNLVSNLAGKANGDVNIKGTFKNPQISGLTRIQQAEFTVNYLRTHYSLENQSALLDNNAIMLQNVILKDPKGNQGTANGIINLAKLKNPYIDVDISTKNVMILNTTFKDNNLYYGTAYASGIFRFKGNTSNINIDINARSESNTVVTIPFNSAMTVSDNDFIYFVSKDSLENQKQERKSLFKGLTMNMNIAMTPDAEVNLPTSLGTLRGNGRGEIAMKISSLGDFEMFGDYVVSQGKFHFTAQDFINKYFDIKEGGTIRWTGNPSEAIINLNAIYQQRTSVGPLYNAAGRQGEDERVLAQADMLIKGTLEQPDITFELNFPQNPYIKDQLQSYLSDANNVNQQALSLIVRRSFTPGSTSEIGREVNNTLLSAGTEIAFNQLNSIISNSLNINFFDLNIRSLNDASASVRLLNDRLVLTGGITDRTNFQATDLTFFQQGITTDAELTYRLRKDGNLILRAYNRPYTRNFLIRTTDAEYISALGLVYRQEFNSISQFWQKLLIWDFIKKTEKPKEKKD